MGSLTPLTLLQRNTETIAVTITPDDVADDLTTITRLTATIKESPCVADTASGVVTLSSADPTEITILTQVAAEITAEVYLPATITTPPHGRWWRLDAWIGTAYRTALYGPITVVDL